MGDRIAVAEQNGQLGEIEGLNTTRAAAEHKLAQLEERARKAATVSIPTYREIASHAATLPENQES